MTRERIEHEAEDLLRRFGITEAPVNPTLLAEALGFRVRAALFRDPALHGRIVVDGALREIEIAATDAANRRRFTIAHELGHAVLHLKDKTRGGYDDTRVQLFRLSSIVPGSDDDEVQANRFAAALLMPGEWVRQAYESDASIPSLARRFNVSADAMTYRLKNLGLVP